MYIICYNVIQCHCQALYEATYLMYHLSCPFTNEHYVRMYVLVVRTTVLFVTGINSMTITMKRAVESRVTEHNVDPTHVL